MTRRRRTKVLVDGSASLRERLARDIEKSHEILTIDAPSHGLAMLTVRESARGSLFHPGELLVTEAKVQVAGRIGLGIIAGEDGEAAWCLAVIDAACKAGLPETYEWEPLLLEEERQLEDRRAAEHARILETRVRFETMDG